MHGGWNYDYDLDDARFADSTMKDKLVFALWTIGYGFVVLWTGFMLFLVIDAGRINLGMGLRIALGMFGAWQGFKSLREKLRNSATSN